MLQHSPVDTIGAAGNGGEEKKVIDMDAPAHLLQFTVHTL